MRPHSTYDEYDLATLDREHSARVADDKAKTPRLSALLARLDAREWDLRSNLGRSAEADTLLLIIEGLRYDLGFREIEPAAADDLAARWLVDAHQRSSTSDNPAA